MRLDGIPKPQLPTDLVKNAVESKLPKPFRQEMEKAFGDDFSQVKVYQSHLPTLQGAEAFANGNDLHFAPGVLDSGSANGLKLMAHELAHVVQQAGGRVAAQAEPVIESTIASAAGDGSV